MNNFYPMAVGNVWTYKMKDGKTFTNTVLSANGQTFTMQNSTVDHPQYMRIDGDTYLADNFEAGNFQVLLKDNLKKGDKWEVKYKANNFENVLYMTVLDTGANMSVEGKTYTDVTSIEGDMKINVNGNLTSVNYKVQYYYARGVGLILTTSSYGDTMGLVSYKLN